MKKLTKDSLKTENEKLKKKLEKTSASLKRAKHDLDIESSLEKVRTTVMDMQNSEELISVCESVYRELIKLGFSKIRNAQIAIKNDVSQTYRVCEFSDYNVVLLQEAPYNSSTIVAELYHELGKSKDALYQKEFSGRKFEEWRSWRKSFGSSTDYRIEQADSVCFYLYSFESGHLGISTFDAISKNQIEILQRFKNVFELSYRRFIDVSRAESQAKEAKIEASLERVRSQALSMRKQDESLGICSILFTELRRFGFAELRNTQILINNEDQKSFLNYDFSEFSGAHIAKVYFESHIKTRELVEQIKKTDDAFVEFVISGDELDDWRAWREKNGEYDDERIARSDSLHYYFYSIGMGAIGISTFKPISEDELFILKRFRNVFGLAFRRYMDVSKAEAQAREAQLELGLERVRAKAMSMQKSVDLETPIAILFEELEKLNLGIFRCGIGIINKEKRNAEVWTTVKSDNQVLQVSGDESMDIHPLLRGVFEAWLKQEDFSYELQGKNLQDYYQALAHTNFRLPESESLPSEYQSQTQFHFNAIIPAGGLFAFRDTPFSDEDKNVMRRFAHVFDLTYTRFLDLQKAEAQTRESLIELGLERVRARAMAMRRSEELSELVEIVFKELTKLDLALTRCILWIIDEETFTARTWMANPEINNTPESFLIGFIDHPYHQALIKAWKERNPKWVYELKGEEKKFLDKWVFSETEASRLPAEVKKAMTAIEKGFLSFSFHHFGALQADGLLPLSDEHMDILFRFGKVFDLTYTRFNDLKQAELQAREANIETGLERVRSRTLAMQKSDELAETAAVVFKQLIQLGIEPNRLYIGIIKDDSGDIELWATDEGGGKVNTQFTGNIYRNQSMQKMYQGWKDQKKSITIDMQGSELADYFHYLSEELKVPFKFGLDQKRRVQNIGYFAKGFLGIASPESQPEETIALLERFAAVFNLTYTRFNDLKLAESQAERAHLDLIKLQTEKKRAEEALIELRAAQAQLVQSEKMASLGELTAGIAHEIQNPLNFVNNFSEVSNELIEEMNGEIEKGDMQEAMAIASNLKQNLEKITHHGKRADAIVKSMLLHSRSSSGVKESIYINALADEYLRLAYHGLRAKDMSFNATVKTDFDQTIGQIEVNAQDMGRVILNLITNAFYAVTEKKKSAVNHYEPTVSVSTKRINGHIEIRIADNGPGIPQKVLEKIFQPFFTTKPTGQGTGLGLSLSYDIVKAHGGELKVETQEGESATFVILIPC